jgi:hypothetical protein
MGATACPNHLNFDTISHVCKGSVTGNYLRTQGDRTSSSSENNLNWAGLAPAGSEQDTIDLLDFVRSMGNNHNSSDDQQQLRFLFDVPLVELCPTLLKDIFIPPHFVNRAASQFLYRHLSDEDIGKCESAPFFNMYLAEEGFETNLHVDAAHTAFVASMCQGHKKWRVMLPHDFNMAHAELSWATNQEEKLVNGKWIMSDVKRPFETWNSSVSPLESLDVVIYEGLLEPNEILYIPPGAPHAATTLDHSLMVASNDQSMQSLHEIIQYCDQDRNQWHGCSHFRDRFSTISENYKLHNHDDLGRKRMSFGQSVDCEEAFSQLAESRLEITPLNFVEEVQKGPIIIMKYVRSCISCIRYLKMLQTDLDPPVRLGVLNCPDGTCPPGESKEYQKVLPMIRSTCPEFVFVTPSDYYKNAIRGIGINSDHSRQNEREGTMTVIHYYGPLQIDFLKVWIGLKTGSKVDISPSWYKSFIVACHMMNSVSVAYLQGRGVPPMADDAIGFSAVLFLFVVISACIILCGTLRTGKSSPKKQKTR